MLAKLFLITGWLFAFAVAPALADEQAQLKAGEARASGVIGENVVNAQGEDLGEIKDLIVDLSAGTVHAAVIEFGGFLGLGEKLYAFPSRQLTTALDRDKVILNVDRESSRLLKASKRTGGRR